MRRKVLRIITASSLALCLITAVLWIASSFASTVVGIESRKSSDRIRVELRYVIASDVGLLVAGYRALAYTDPLPGARRDQLEFFHEIEAPGRPDSFRNSAFDRRFIGVVLRRATWSGPGDNQYSAVLLGVPYWLLLVLFGASPARTGIAWLRKRRAEAAAKRGICRACGYDLRATPDRCPECGATVAAQPR